MAHFSLATPITKNWNPSISSVREVCDRRKQDDIPLLNRWYNLLLHNQYKLNQKPCLECALFLNTNKLLPEKLQPSHSQNPMPCKQSWSSFHQSKTIPVQSLPAHHIEELKFSVNQVFCKFCKNHRIQSFPTWINQVSNASPLKSLAKQIPRG